MAATDITVLLTGPTRGFGRQLTMSLAARGVRMVLVGRDGARMDEVSKEAKSAGATHVTCVAADFASLTSVSSAGERVAAMVGDGELSAINVVIANAGGQWPDRMTSTADGYESTFGVNVLANHALLTALMPVTAEEAHVIVIGSGTHFGKSGLVAGPHWAEPNVLARPGTPAGPFAADTGKAGQSAYSTSKLAVNYLVQAWQRHAANDRRFNVYDPGMMPGTGLVRSGPRYRQLAWRYVMPALTLLPIPGVASTRKSSVHLTEFALGYRYPEARGAYVELAKLSKASDESANQQREEALWAFCEAVTTPHLIQEPMKGSQS